MPIYEFDDRFVPLVESRRKCQTIRKTEKGGARGVKAYLWTRGDTPMCRKIGEGTLLDVAPIEIGRDECGEPYAIRPTPLAICHAPTNRVPPNLFRHTTGKIHLRYQLNPLAKAEGFSSGEEMVAWFEDKYGLPYRGYLHSWTFP